MGAKQVLAAADYAVILIFLIISALIGVAAKLMGGEQKTTAEYFLADKKAPMFLVIFSSMATILSAVSMLGSPAEIYRFGIDMSILPLGVVIGIFLASIIFTPVYFELKVDSIYEYLEKRFGRLTRYATSAVFVLQMILYSATVLYAPVLALNSMTNIPFEMGIILCGSVCTFYCLVGGLKAVLWTDLFQSVLMVLCLLIVFVAGISEVGGVGEVFRRAAVGNRLQYFDMRFDFTTRYTFWNMTLRGIILGMHYYGANQVEVQRSLSMSNHKRAQRALHWSSLAFTIVYSMTCYSGIIIYAVFYLCDPVLMNKETGISKYDQLFPYFIITRLKSFPGLTGLCIAGIFSGSLSSISSAINSMSTVSVIDFVVPSFPRQLSQRTLVLIAKGLCLLFGTILIGITFAISNIDSIFLVCMAFMSLAEGPVLTLFLIGMLSRKVSDKSATIGLFIGIVLIGWITFGTTFSGYSYPSLPLETSNCRFLPNATIDSKMHCSNNCTSLNSSVTQIDLFFLYKIPAPWIPSFGFIIAFITILTTSLLIDRNRNIIPSDSKCLSPVVYFWMSKSSQVKESKSKEISPMNQENEL